MEPTTLDSFLNIPERIIFVALLMIVLPVSLHTVYKRCRLISLGQKREEKIPEHIIRRLWRLFMYVPGQWCNIRTIRWKDFAGIEHLFIFWGVILFGIYYFAFIVVGDGFGFGGSLRHSLSYLLSVYVIDVTAVILVISFVSGLARRGLLKPKRLGPDYETRAFFLITLVTFIAVTCYFCVEGLRFTLQMDTAAGPISKNFAASLKFSVLHPATQLALLHVAWWIQYSIVLGFIVYIPYSHHQHALYSPLNIFLNSYSWRGILPLLNFDKKQFGASRIEEFTWKDLLDLYSCTQCGRCQDVCPAYSSGKSLSPKKLINDLRENLDERGNFYPLWKNRRDKRVSELKLIDGAVSTEEIWACTTCMACTSICPAMVEHANKIIDLRRDLVLRVSDFPDEISSVFWSLEFYGDPYEMGKNARADCIKESSGTVNVKEASRDDTFDILFWVGCTGAFYERNRQVINAVAKILNAAGTRFRVLGSSEKCCGDPARRLGNEYLFKKLARKNISTFKRHGIKKIITCCPHCFNVFKNEYPQLGARFTVVFYTELLAELTRNGKLGISEEIRKTITYHDPCYQGRYNGLYKSPRDILKRIPEATLREMNHSKDKSFCCGAGGGHLWLEEKGKRINEIRIAEAMEVKPDILATSCPFCLIMLDDGVKSIQMESLIQVMDVAELISVPD